MSMNAEEAGNHHSHINRRHCLSDRLAREALEQALREIRLPAGAWTLTAATLNCWDSNMHLTMGRVHAAVRGNRNFFNAFLIYFGR